jgi:hypothetical protein
MDIELNILQTSFTHWFYKTLKSRMSNVFFYISTFYQCSLFLLAISCSCQDNFDVMPLFVALSHWRVTWSPKGCNSFLPGSLNRVSSKIFSFFTLNKSRSVFRRRIRYVIKAGNILLIDLIPQYVTSLLWYITKGKVLNCERSESHFQQ